MSANTGRRVGDEERHQCVEMLSEHHAHGRLSQEEFNDRLGAAFDAETVGDLNNLLDDLPTTTDVPWAQGETKTQLEARQPEGKHPDLRAAASGLGTWGTIVVASFVALGITKSADDSINGMWVLIFSLIVGCIGVIVGRLTARPRNQQTRRR